MFDKAKAESLGRKKVSSMEPEPLKKMNTDELWGIKREVDALLGVDVTLKELNLENELVNQYYKIRSLMDSVSTDPDIPANQRAQVSNSVVTTLGQLVKLQEDLKKQEMLKIMEGALIDVVKVLPTKSQNDFFEEYERIAKKAGLM